MLIYRNNYVDLNQSIYVRLNLWYDNHNYIVQEGYPYLNQFQHGVMSEIIPFCVSLNCMVWQSYLYRQALLMKAIHVLWSLITNQWMSYLEVSSRHHDSGGQAEMHVLHDLIKQSLCLIMAWEIGGEKRTEKCMISEDVRAACVCVSFTKYYFINYYQTVHHR